MLRSVLLSITCSLLTSAYAIAETPNKIDAKKVDVPAGDLAAALQQLAKQANAEFVFSPNELKGARTEGLHGEFTAEDAVNKLLEGTQFRLIRHSSGAFLIAPQRDSPLTSEATSFLHGGEKVANSGGGEWMRLSQNKTGTDNQGEGQRSSSSEQTPSSSNPSRNSSEIQEILVTATKRVERLQDVPLSIAVVTAEEIDRRGLVSGEDYLRGIPGVNQVTDEWGSNGAIIIRGLESNSSYQNYYSGQTVATYFGETPTTQSAGLGGNANVDTKLVDIERVEVLRGPQGTAFGNASLGGAVRTIPVAPKLDRFEGKLGAGFSATSGTGGDNYNFQAVGNLPLINDKLALRAVAYRHEESGFYRNVAGSDSTFLAAAAGWDAEEFAVDDNEVGANTFTGARLAALFQPSDNLKFTLTYLTQDTEHDGNAFANTGTYEQTILQVPPEYIARGEKAGVFDVDIDLANATLEYDLGWANLIATYSHIRSESVYKFVAGTPPFVFPLLFSSAGEHREHTGEVRLTTQLDGPWDFLVGLYGEEVKDDFHQDWVWYGSPESNIFGAGRRGLSNNNGDRRSLTQKAAFAEASWEFIPSFTLTGGLRAYEYDRTGTIYSGLVENRDFTDMSAGASGTSFRGNLSHKLNDDALVYASWAQGFRLGVAQLSPPAAVCDRDNNGIVDGTNVSLESTRSVKSDNVDSYEVGGKFTLLDDRLMITASGYRMDWSGLPISMGSAECIFSFRTNAGSARSQGVELQARFHLAEPFSVDVGGSWIRARLTKDAPGIGAIAGDRLPGAPKVNANLGLQYEFKIGGSKAFVRADSIYVGPFYGRIGELAGSEPAGDYVKVDVSARVAARNINVDLFVRNLTNGDEFTWRGAGNPVAGNLFGYRLRPRTVGVQLSYDFK